MNPSDSSPSNDQTSQPVTPVAAAPPPQDITPPASTNSSPTPITPDPAVPTSTSSVSPLPVNSAAKKSKLKWLILIVVAVLVLAGGAYWLMHGKSKPSQANSAAKTSTPTFRIGLSLDTYKELRWEHDRDYMIERAKQLGGSVSVLVADSDDQAQITQIENFISQKVDLIIVVPHDAKAVAPAIAEANKAGIKVLSYDRLTQDSSIDFYISFDNTKVGTLEAQGVMNAVPASVKTANVAIVGGAPTDNNWSLIHNGMMSVLQPLVTAGKAKIVYDQPSPDWSPDVAYANLKAFLDKGGKVDAVVAANDGVGGGAIKALKEHGLDGKVPVSGQDAELAAVQRVVAGTQTLTVYKPLKSIAYKAIDIAVQLIKNQTPDNNNHINNGQKDVLAFYLDPVPVTKDKIKDTLIKDGVFTTQEVYGTASQ